MSDDEKNKKLKWTKPVITVYPAVPDIEWTSPKVSIDEENDEQ